MSQQTVGGKTYKKTEEKIQVGKASRCVYITARGAKHVKIKLKKIKNKLIN